MRANDSFHLAVQRGAGNLRLQAAIENLHRSFPRNLTWSALSGDSRLLADNVGSTATSAPRSRSATRATARKLMTDHVRRSGELVTCGSSGRRSRGEHAGRFAVVGAGAIGAYVGAALVRGGADVTLIARGAHLEAMRRNGVQVYSPRGDFHVAVDATDDLDAIEGAGVVILALKSYSLPELAPAIGARLAPGAAVVAAQNGVPGGIRAR